MKKKSLYLFLLLGLTLCLGATSCCKKQHLYLSKNYAFFAPVGGLRSIRVSSDNHWTVQIADHPEWLSVSPMEGNDGDVLSIRAEEYKELSERSALITVTSENGKVKKTIRVTQRPIEIADLTNKWWFMHFYERWETDFYNDSIEDSYRSWTYWAEPEYDNWFFYFLDDSTGYEFWAKKHSQDTVVFTFNYVYYPLEDSLYINYETDSADVVEDYLTIVEQLDEESFIFRNEWAEHRFERLTMANVTAKKHPFVKPKKITKKPAGPLIQVDN